MKIDDVLELEAFHFHQQMVYQSTNQLTTRGHPLAVVERADSPAFRPCPDFSAGGQEEFRRGVNGSGGAKDMVGLEGLSEDVDLAYSANATMLVKQSWNLSVLMGDMNHQPMGGWRLM